MKLKSIVSVFLILCTLSVNSCIQRMSHENDDCGTLVRSTCSDNLTTKWNKMSVGHTLKHWIKSLAKITMKHGYNKEHIFLNKKMKQFRIKDNTRSGIHYIANFDCETQRSIGPTWMKPSIYSTDPLNDGFLYGIEDENGEMTGDLIRFSSNQKAYYW